MPLYDLITVLVGLIAATVIAFSTMPVAVWLSRKVGAIDVPHDNRRMHHRPIPRLGGVAIIFAFVVTSVLVFVYFPALHNTQSLLLQVLPGAVLIGALGIADDKLALPAWPKFLVQCVAAGIAVWQGVRIDWISGIRLLHIGRLDLGFLAVPLTIFWIVGITNAMNFIDGLDGLAAGVASISSLSILCIAVLKVNLPVAVIAAALAGGCIGALPYNRSPAKIFIGDTGATFLGYTLSIISVQGLFKFYAVISFAVPFLILALPIVDATFAILRRLWEHKAPWTADRSHIHHKLIDLGLSQKQAVAALYSVSVVLGIVAVVSSIVGPKGSWLFFLAGIVAVFIIYVFIELFSRSQRRQKRAKEAAVKKSFPPEKTSLPPEKRPLPPEYGSSPSESVTPPPETEPEETAEPDVSESPPPDKNGGESDG